MQAFIIESANKPGELARHASVIAKRDINVYPFSLGLGSRGGQAFVAADEAGVKSALTSAGITYKEVPVLPIWLEDRPGTAALTAQRLADAGVNIEDGCGPRRRLDVVADQRIDRALAGTPHRFRSGSNREQNVMSRVAKMVEYLAFLTASASTALWGGA